MSKKIYIKIDKPIEVGDLVRCVEQDLERKPGDIRKVSQMGRDRKVFFYVHGSGVPCLHDRWEPVRKGTKMSKKIYIKIDKPIEVGDLVRCVGDTFWFQTGDIRKVCSLDGDHLSLMGDASLAVLTKYWEPVRKETRVSEIRRAEMERAVADMIVELLDKDLSTTRLPIITCYSNPNKNTRIYFEDEGYDAKLAPNDTWDTLTGVFVALSKATGRKLPDWIYGEER